MKRKPIQCTQAKTHKRRDTSVKDTQKKRKTERASAFARNRREDNSDDEWRDIAPTQEEINSGGWHSTARPKRERRSTSPSAAVTVQPATPNVCRGECGQPGHKKLIACHIRSGHSRGCDVCHTHMTSVGMMHYGCLYCEHDVCTVCYTRGRLQASVPQTPTEARSNPARCHACDTNTRGDNTQMCMAMTGFDGCCKSVCREVGCEKHPLVNRRCAAHQEFGEGTEFTYYTMMGGPYTSTAKKLGWVDQSV